MLTPPSAYVDGYARARAVDQEAADHYIRHTSIGDPELDPVMEELAELPPADMHRFIRAGVEQDDEVTLRRAPQVLRDFFDNMEVPDWVDFEASKPGQDAFYNHMSNMLVAYAIGSAVEGFSTLVSKSFSITGRVTGLGPGAGLRDYWDRALVFLMPPGFQTVSNRDPKVAWIEERVYGMVAPELGRAMRMRNHANFLRTYGREYEPPTGVDLERARAVLRDIEAALRVLGFLTGVPAGEARFSLRLAAA